MKKYYFLSGLPRCGNTLLSCILNQNENICVTANSPVAEIIYELKRTKEQSVNFKHFPDHNSFDNVILNVFDSYYKHWKADVILDRAQWGLPRNFENIKEYCPNDPKIIVLYRDIFDILSSFLIAAEKDPNNIFAQNNITNVEDKCRILLDENALFYRSVASFYNLHTNIDKKYYISLHYDNLVNNTEKSIKKIYKFLEIEYYNHNFDNLNQFEVNGVKYSDDVFIKDLHKIKTNKIEKTEYDYKEYIPKSIIEQYKHFNFWMNKTF